MKRFLLIGCLAAALGALVFLPTSEAQTGDWVQLFNGKDLTGWKPHPEQPGKWSVEDGCIVGRGKAVSHLFSEKGDYENFHLKFTAKISDQGNSGQYFRAKFMKGYPNGYEAQINSTHTDPVRTGSLYNFAKVNEQLHKPDEWFTQEVIAKGNHIQILVNGKKTVDYTDAKNTHTKGHFAIQQHPPAKNGPDSVVTVKKIEYKPLP